MHDLRGLWPLGKPRQCQRHLRGVGPALVLLQLFNNFFVLVTELRMSATDTAMDTGEKVYGGCEGPDAM